MRDGSRNAHASITRCIVQSVAVVDAGRDDVNHYANVERVTSIIKPTFIGPQQDDDDEDARRRSTIKNAKHELSHNKHTHKTSSGQGTHAC